MTTVITVSTAAELRAALNNCRGGEVIELAGGDYGTLKMNPYNGMQLTFPSNVTITSADPENPAIFSTMGLVGVSNLTLDGLVFDYTFQPGDVGYYKPFTVSDSHNVTITNSTFDGDLAYGVSEAADGFGYAYGLMVRNSGNVAVSGNEFYDFFIGSVFLQSTDLVVSDNDIHSMRMDGLEFADVQGVLIEGNYIHDFSGSPTSGDHPDMIQFWTTGTSTPSTDITIRGNHLDIGEGTWTQSIFMRNEVVDTGLAGTEMYYQNVTIENNVIVNGHSHGISVGESNGLTISNNTVVHSDGGYPDGADSMVEIPQINLSAGSTNVTITQNITAGINGHAGQAGWTVTGNTFVQDQDIHLPGWYGDVFISTSLDAVDGVHNPVALPGGAAALAGAGAPGTLAPQIGEFEAHYQIGSTVSDAATRHFDASVSLGDLPAGTSYSWDFGDGTGARGKSLSHVYADPGDYMVTLTITRPDGSKDTVSSEISIANPYLVVQTANGFVTGWVEPAAPQGDSGMQFAAARPDNTSLQLGATGTTLSVSSQHLYAIKGADDLAINFTLQADAAGASGEVVRLHGSFIVSVNAKGELLVQATRADGTVAALATSGANLTDLAAHDLAITLADGLLSVSVDGRTMATANIPDGLAFSGNHNLVFGNPWGQGNFSGNLSGFSFTANEDDFGTTRTYGEEQPETGPLHKIVTFADDGGFSLFTGEGSIKLGNAALQDGAIRLGETGKAAWISASHFGEVDEQDSFTLTFTLEAGEAGERGAVVRLPGAFAVRVNAGGELVVFLVDDEGDRTKLVTSGAGLNDGAAHDVAVVMVDGLLGVLVDGQLRGAMAAEDGIGLKGHKDLSFGFGFNNFAGDISDFTFGADVLDQDHISQLHLAQMNDFVL